MYSSLLNGLRSVCESRCLLQHFFPSLSGDRHTGTDLCDSGSSVSLLICPLRASLPFKFPYWPRLSHVLLQIAFANYNKLPPAANRSLDPSFPLINLFCSRDHCNLMDQASFGTGARISHTTLLSRICAAVRTVSLEKRPRGTLP